jgi:hypothetical protein
LTFNGNNLHFAASAVLSPGNINPSELMQSLKRRQMTSKDKFMEYFQSRFSVNSNKLFLMLRPTQGTAISAFQLISFTFCN